MNPQKYMANIELQSFHRVIVVVFVPEESDYYKDVFEVFKLCLKSIQATTNSLARITIVNNACHQKVTEYINKEYIQGTVDCVIHHKENIGKMDALIGAARSSRETLVTLTDTDILFENGWQNAVEHIFKNIPKTGAVSPVSVRTALHYVNSSTLRDIVLKKLKFEWKAIPKNIFAFDRFKNSFGHNYKTPDTAKWPVISYNGVQALLGADHQVLTVRRELLFLTVPIEPSLILVAKGSERLYIDQPVDQASLYRLSTYTNYAHHMGNRVEKWMYDLQNENLKSTPVETSFFEFVKGGCKISSRRYRVRVRFFTYLFKKIYNSESHK